MVNLLWRPLLLVWTLVLLFAISWPWSKFDGIAHWEQVHWIPFSHVRLTPALLKDFEFIANILVFVPLGFFVVRSFPLKFPCTWRSLILAFFVGGLCSVGLEFYQLFCRDRVPSTTDVINNVSGTIFGAWMALRIDHTLDFFTLRFRRLSS